MVAASFFLQIQLSLLRCGGNYLKFKVVRMLEIIIHHIVVVHIVEVFIIDLIVDDLLIVIVVDGPV